MPPSQLRRKGIRIRTRPAQSDEAPLSAQLREVGLTFEMLVPKGKQGSGGRYALLSASGAGHALLAADRRWDTVGMDRLGWLSEYSEPALRSALRVGSARLDQLPIELTGTNDLSRPTWASGSATVDGRFLAKFAFSEPTAVRVWHEARVLKLLADLPAFDVPDVVAASPDPACLATRIVDGGVPLSYELVRDRCPSGSIRSVPNWPSSWRICTLPRSSRSPATGSTIHCASRSPGYRPRPTSCASVSRR